MKGSKNSSESNKQRLDLEIIKFNPEMITNFTELKEKILAKNGKPKPENRFMYSFFVNLKKEINARYENEVDPLEYIYYLYYTEEKTTKQIYNRYAHLGGYKNKNRDSIKRLMLDILNWPLRGEIDKNIVGERKRHQKDKITEDIKNNTRNILEETNEQLISIGVELPITDNNELNKYSPEIRNIIIRYNHLYLNQIFSTRNQISFLYSTVSMESGVNNGKKDIIEEFPFAGLNKEAISYPLNQIYIYLTQNCENLKSDNTKQIEVAKKFKIGNLGILYRIVTGLGLLKELDWKLVNLSVEKYEELIIEVGKLENSGKEINGKSLFNLTTKLGINNSTHFHTALSSIGITEKYGFNKIILSNSNNVLKIIEYVEQIYGIPKESYAISLKDIDKITYEFKDILPKRYTDKTRAIKSILTFFGYIVVSTKTSKSINNPIIHTKPVFF